MNDAQWTLSDHRAACRLADHAATIDLERPADGIAVARAAADGFDRLLGVDLRSPSRLVEHWIRGGDVAAVYETADARRLRATAMWRLPRAANGPPAPRGVTVWELVLSAQTSLLESDSSLAVSSLVAATNIEPFGLGGVLARRGDGTSLLIVVHPDDRRRVSWTVQEGGVSIACWLFSSAVEKGVLLRSRVRAAIGPADGDTAWAEALADAFAGSPPVLTA